MSPQDPEGLRLAQIVAKALELVQAGSNGDAELDDSSVWVNQTFVQGYFRRMAEYSESVHDGLV